MALGVIALAAQIAGAILSHRQERSLATYVEMEATVRYTAVDRNTSTQRRKHRVTTTTTYHPIVGTSTSSTVSPFAPRSSRWTARAQAGSPSEVAAMIARFPVGS